MVYPTLPKQIEQKTIRENYVDPLDPFLKKNFQNPTTQDPNSKIHIEQIQNPNPQKSQENILRGSKIVSWPAFSIPTSSPALKRPY